MHKIGIDIGGTFTDIAGFINGQMYYAKAPSSPDVVQGVVDGVRLMLEKAEVDPRRDDLEITHIHGTTIATNALLERKGARIGLLTTEGHRDALELGRMKRSKLYDFQAPPETPGFLAPGRMRIGIAERTGADGSIVKPLEATQVIEAVRHLRERYDIEALAVCFLNSYMNPAHEIQAGEIVETAFPGLLVSLSHRVNPMFREYERVCCTAFDAYVRPKVVHYVRQLEAELKSEGEDARLHLMQSGGGVGSAEMTIDRPVTMFLSGPAAGVIGARYAGGISGHGNLIGFDVGGTSTDVALIQGGKAQITREGKVASYPLRVPMVDMDTVGSGGGSIAWIDAGGGLHMGPESAGAVPGPACYDRGGDRPTSTDASIVLGYLNPGYFAEGTLKLRDDLSRRVIGALAERLELSETEAALGMYRILISQMADAIKLVTVRRGLDPRESTLVSFGGGGGIYASAVAREIGIKEVLVPRSPGTLCAFGMLVADFETDGGRTVFVKNTLLADSADIEAKYRELEAAGEAKLQAEGIAGVPVRHRRTAEMRYEGQGYELEVPIEAPFDGPARALAAKGFHKVHDKVYGHFNPERIVELVNLRVVSYQSAAPLPDDVLTGDLPPKGSPFEPYAKREAIFPDHGGMTTPVFRRNVIPLEGEIEGPAIIEQADTTVVIHPGQTAVMDRVGNVIIAC